MTYFADLSEYTYFEPLPGTKNIGWLSAGHDFKRAVLPDFLLERLWQFCKVSIAQSRGIHNCELCSEDACRVQRNDERLLLGTSEIRVFGTAGEIYAAPTLIYHYIVDHHYAPPEEFLVALQEGASPPDKSYFDRLVELGLTWNATLQWTERRSERPVRGRLGSPQKGKKRP
jgi:hypothetical protein